MKEFVNRNSVNLKCEFIEELDIVKNVNHGEDNNLCLGLS